MRDPVQNLRPFAGHSRKQERPLGGNVRRATGVRAEVARAAAATDRLAVALGRGLVAGVAATAAMTVASTLEMRLRGRPPSAAPAQVAGQVLGIPRPEQASGRFAVIAHAATGVSLGTTRGLLDLAGVRGPAAGAIFFAIAWAPDLVGVPAAGAAQPPWRWGVAETAISAVHHGVYAAAGDAVYRTLSRG